MSGHPPPSARPPAACALEASARRSARTGGLPKSSWAGTRGASRPCVVIGPPSMREAGVFGEAACPSVCGLIFFPPSMRSPNGMPVCMRSDRRGFVRPAIESCPYPRVRSPRRPACVMSGDPRARGRFRRKPPGPRPRSTRCGGAGERGCVGSGRPRSRPGWASRWRVGGENGCISRESRGRPRRTS